MLELEKVLTDKNYSQIDHIIPQSLIKDDSIDNRVLVLTKYNQDKKDFYPLAKTYPDWVARQKPFWIHLVKMNLMSKKKFTNLIRTDELTENEIGDFVARQLVETNQSAKAVIDILKTFVNDPRDVIYSKAGFVSDFRNEFNIPKSRLINNLHHAKDAYLNIVVGNVLFNRFTDDPRNFYRKDKYNSGITKNIRKLFDNKYDKDNKENSKPRIIKNYSTGEVVWNSEKDLIKVKETCARNDCLVSRMSYTDENNAFYDETIYKSTKNDAKTNAKISLKGSENNPLHDVSKYGGYNKMAIAYFMVVESEDKKGNKIKTIEAVPIYIIRKFRKEPDKEEKIFEYVVQENNLKNAKVLFNKLKIKSKLIIDKGTYLLAGKTNDKYSLHNANEWFVNDKLTNYIKIIEKYIKMKRQKQTDKLEEREGKVVISPARTDKDKELALSIKDNKILYGEIIRQLDKNIYQNLNLASVGEYLRDNFEKFENLSIFNQAELLYNVMRRVSPGATLTDLTLIGGKASAGFISLGKNITDKQIKLVQESCTGLYKKIIKL